MNLEVKKKDQGPVIAAKGDVNVGVANGAGPVTVDTGGGGTLSGPVTGSSAGPAPGVRYGCSF